MKENKKNFGMKGNLIFFGLNVYYNHSQYKERDTGTDSSQGTQSDGEGQGKHRGGQHGCILRKKEGKNGFFLFPLSAFLVIPKKFPR